MDTRITASTSLTPTLSAAPLDRPVSTSSSRSSALESQGPALVPMPDFFAALALMTLAGPRANVNSIGNFTQSQRVATTSIELSTKERDWIRTFVGEPALSYIDDKKWEFSDAGFSNEEVVAIASRGNLNSLKGILENCRKSFDLGFTREEILRIGNRIGGAPALSAALSNYERLTRAGFSHFDIVSIASQRGSEATIEKLVEIGQALRAAGFNHDQIVFITAHPSASHVLDRVLATHEQLRTAGFSIQDIVFIATRKSALASLDKVIATHEQLLAAGLTNGQIVANTTKATAPAKPRSSTVALENAASD